MKSRRFLIAICVTANGERSVGFTFWVDNRNADQPVPSIPTRFDLAFIH